MLTILLLYYFLIFLPCRSRNIISTYRNAFLHQKIGFPVQDVRAHDPHIGLPDVWNGTFLDRSNQQGDGSRRTLRRHQMSTSGTPGRFDRVQLHLTRTLRYVTRPEIVSIKQCDETIWNIDRRYLHAVTKRRIYYNFIMRHAYDIRIIFYIRRYSSDLNYYTRAQSVRFTIIVKRALNTMYSDISSCPLYIINLYVLYDRPLKTGFCIIGRGHSATRWEIKHIDADVSITNAFDHFFWPTEFYCSIVFYFFIIFNYPYYHLCILSQ